MELKFIKTTCCPICKCRSVVSESRRVDSLRNEVMTHCNGGQWETRKFLCGYEVSFIPNGNIEERTGQCKNDSVRLKRKQQISDFQHAILEFIRNYEDIPDDIRSGAITAFDYLSYRM